MAVMKNETSTQLVRLAVVLCEASGLDILIIIVTLGVLGRSWPRWNDEASSGTSRAGRPAGRSRDNRWCWADGDSEARTSRERRTTRGTAEAGRWDASWATARAAEAGHWDTSWATTRAAEAGDSRRASAREAWTAEAREHRLLWVLWVLWVFAELGSRKASNVLVTAT